MNLEAIKDDFKSKVCREIDLVAEGTNRFRVFAPFTFDDGDELSILLKKNGAGWYLTDEGHTYMHLSYDMDVKDLERGQRAGIIETTLRSFSVQDRSGELVAEVSDDGFGNALFSFIQALIKISDVSYLSRERARSTFMEDLMTFVRSVVSKERLSFDYLVPEHDTKGIYPIDCRINGMERPLFLFGIPTDDKCRDVTISILQYERWGLSFRPLGVFEQQEQIGRTVLARFSDVVDRQFSNLSSNKERIKKYLEEVLS